MNSLLLSTDNWDLTIDGSNNIATATGGYAVAQDVASAIRTFLGECYYDTLLGIPFFTIALGQRLSQSALQSAINAQALNVNGVVQAKTTLNPLNQTTRLLTGTVSIIDTNGQAMDVTF